MLRSPGVESCPFPREAPGVLQSAWLRDCCGLPESHCWPALSRSAGLATRGPGGVGCVQLP